MDTLDDANSAERKIGLRMGMEKDLLLAVCDALVVCGSAVSEGKGMAEMTDMCYATKSSEVCIRIQDCIEFGKTLKETIEYILSKYDGITEEYFIEKYN